MICPYCGAELSCKEYVKKKLQGRFNVADVLREISRWEKQIVEKHDANHCVEKHAQSGILQSVPAKREE